MQSPESVILIPTSQSSHHLARLISGSPSCQSGQIEVVYPLGNSENQDVFPDGEVYVRLRDEVMDFEGRIVVLHSGMPNPNDGLARLEMILQILSGSKATVEVFFSYFSYGRQDHVRHVGETNVARNIVAKLVNYYDVSKIYVIDPHFGNQTWIIDYPIVQIKASPVLYTTVRRDHPDVIFMAPDAGSQGRNKLPGTKKTRRSSFDVEVAWDEEFQLSVEGKVVGVVDDLISTGNTLRKFSEACKQCCAKFVVAVSTHGVNDSGIRRVKNLFGCLYLTNSIETPYSNVDISGLIIHAIQAPPAQAE